MVVDVAETARDVRPQQVVDAAPHVGVGPQPRVHAAERRSGALAQAIAQEHGAAERARAVEREHGLLHLDSERARGADPVRVPGGIGVVEHAPQHLIAQNFRPHNVHRVVGSGRVGGTGQMN